MDVMLSRSVYRRGGETSGLGPVYSLDMVCIHFRPAASPFKSSISA